MRRFLKEHGYDTALAVFLLVFGGSIISLFGDVLAAFGSYPWAVAACCGLSLVVGLGISAIADRRAVMVAKIHEDGETERAKLERDEREGERKRSEAEAEERARLDAERSEAARVASVRRMEFRDKEYLHSIYANGSVDIPVCFRWEMEQKDFADMVDYETIGENDRWSLLPWAKGLLDRNADVFEPVIESASEEDDVPFP